MLTTAAVNVSDAIFEVTWGSRLVSSQKSSYQLDGDVDFQESYYNPSILSNYHKNNTTDSDEKIDVIHSFGFELTQNCYGMNICTRLSRVVTNIMFTRGSNLLDMGPA
jgi:hypothetical protein